MFTVQYVKNPVYVSEDKTTINCVVKFNEQTEEHPYTAYINDIVQHGREIYNDLIAGKYGEIGPYVAPPSPPAPPKPTLEQLHSQLAALTTQINALANTGQ